MGITQSILWFIPVWTPTGLRRDTLRESNELGTLPVPLYPAWPEMRPLFVRVHGILGAPLNSSRHGVDQFRRVVKLPAPVYARNPVNAYYWLILFFLEK